MKDPRGSGAGEREGGATGARTRMVDVREEAVGARESALSSRELSMSEREELASLRDGALRAREELSGAMAEQVRLMDQMREANEKLVLATMRAEELAEQADAARLAMADSEERFRSLVTTSAAVVWYANAEGRIHVDPAIWLAFTGLDVDTQDEEPGWLHAIHPDDRADVLETWSQATRTTTPYTHQHRLRRPDGSFGWVASRAVPILRGGAVREWIGMMTDVNDRVLVEEARERFIGILGHDLRTPLSAVLTGAALLEQTQGPETVARAAAAIGRSALRMERMIEDLLDFARGRLGGGIAIRREPIDLGRLLMEEAEEMRHAYPGREIRCDASGDLAGSWDPSRVEQMLSNLVGNAIQHGAGPVSVAALGEGDAVILRIHNQGGPIPDSVMKSLFEPFHGRARQDSDGLGLGLYIVSEIVRAHGGSLSVSSTEDEGTTFVVRLPRHDGPGGSASALAPGAI